MFFLFFDRLIIITELFISFDLFGYFLCFITITNFDLSNLFFIKDMKYTSSLALTALFASADARRCNQFHPADAAQGTLEFRNDKSEVFTTQNGYGNSTNHMKFDKDGLFCVNLKSHITNKGS